MKNWVKFVLGLGAAAVAVGGAVAIMVKRRGDEEIDECAEVEDETCDSDSNCEEE